MLTNTVFLIVIFAVAASVSGIIAWQLTQSPIEKRLASIAQGGTPTPPAAGMERFLRYVARLLAPLSALSAPKDLPEHSAFNVRFYSAGLRSQSAPITYFTAKTVLTFLLPGALLLYLGVSGSTIPRPPLLAMLLLLAAIGYYLPNATLARLVARRQRELFEVFPDALDLIRVCVESGLSLDAAIERVGREMDFESPALSDELHLVSLELRAGASRIEALRHLALRISLEDVDALVSTLVQADRFGTTITEALRVHSEALRTKRRLLAEERAAKLPVKLLFPLIFCIFPSLLTVLLGPSFVTIYRMLMKMLSK